MDIAKKSLIWMILFMAIAFGGAYAYLRYTAPLYRSSATIQFAERNSSDKILTENDLYDDDNLAAKLEFLRSKYMLREALGKLPLEIGYYTQGEVLTMQNYRRSPYTVIPSDMKDSCMVGMQVGVLFKSESQVEISYTYRGKEFRETSSSLTGIQTQHCSFDIEINDYQAIQALQQENKLYFTFNDLDKLTRAYFRSLSIKILNQDAKTVQVTFTSENPLLARDLVTALAKTFIEFDLERKGESAESILTFIDSQLDTVYRKLRTSESEIQQFKKNNQLTSSLEDLSGVYMERLGKFEEQLIRLDLELGLLDEITNAVQADPKNVDVYNLIPILIGSSYEGTLGEMITSLSDMLLQKEEQLFSHNPKSEYIRNLEYRIDIQKNLILSSVKSIKERLINRKALVAAQLSTHEQSFYSLPTKELEFARLQRLFEINEKFYTLLLQKKAEYSISKAGFVPENEILEAATLPKAPISPNKNMARISFGLLGLFLCVVLVLVRYLLYNDITSVNEITKGTNGMVSVLGIVPKYKRKIPVSQLLIYKNPKSLIAEAFRMIRSNLQFIDNAEGPKTIAVTSTISGEGKTFVAINLAGIIAYSGKKVIILDLDMRKPKIHIGFGVENVIGMSTLLIGKDEIKNCINHSNLDNLDYITAGPIPPNPSELIINGRIDNILEELRKEYDVVIVDNPPIGLVTDGISLIQKADYPIYIFRANYSKRNFVQNVDRLLNENKIKKLSVILNSVEQTNGSTGYGYGYGYGYGGGYNYYDEDVEEEGGSWLKRIFKRK